MPRSYHYAVFALGVLTTLVVLGGGRPAWSQPTPDEPVAPVAKPEMPKIQEVVDGIELFTKRNFEAAEKKFEEAFAKHPQDLPPPQIILAQLFAQANQGGLMQVALEKAVVKYPDDPEAYVILGNIALQGRSITAADLLYTKAVATMKNFTASPKRKESLEPQTLSGLAAVAEARDDWKLAQTYLDKLLTMLPKETEGKARAKASVLQRLARAYFQQKETKKALENLRAAYAADKENVLTPEAALGRFYEQFGDRQNATLWMGYALKYHPEDLRTRLVLGQWALEVGKTDEALQHAEKAMQLDSKSLEAEVLRGVVALFKKDYPTAEKYFENAHLKSPGNFAATNNLALALCEQKDKQKKERALQYANNNFQQNSKNAEAASTLGWVLYRWGDLEKAERALGMAAQSGNLSADTAYYLAQILYDRGQARSQKELKEQALNLLDAALKVDANGNPRQFSMRPEAVELQTKLAKEIAAAPKEKPKDAKQP